MFCYGLFLACMVWVGWLEGLGVFYFLGLGVAATIALYHFTLRITSYNVCYTKLLRS